MKLALVHDWLNQIGGAEDVLAELHTLYPNAPIYSSLYWREGMPAAMRDWPIRTLWLDRLPGIYRHHQRYLPLYPLAFGGLNLGDYEVILSNKSGFCHGLQKGRAVHICYCLAPTRYVWQYDAYMQREQVRGALKALVRPVIAALRRWDYAAAQRVDHFIAISTEIQARIRKFYGRDSVVIFPPVDVATRFQPVARDQVGDYYLAVSRLIPYKRIDLAVQACTRLNLPLIVGGRGRDLEKLKAMAGPTVQFIGYVADEDLPGLMARCKAFLFPGLDDFGITPVQAQAAGRPVIAYRGGGALDTVLGGMTGEFFDQPTVDSLIAAIQRFETKVGQMGQYDSAAISAHALKFDRAVFQAQIAAFVQAHSAR